MLKPSYLSSVANDVVDVFNMADSDICASLASRIAKMDFSESASSWRKQSTKQYLSFQEEVDGIIAKSTKLSKREISRIMKEAGKTALAFDDAIYRAAGLDPVDLASSPALQAVLLQGTEKTLTLVKNFTKTTAAAANSSFRTLADRAYLQVMSGGFDPTTAIRQAVNLLAREGIEKIAYPSGGFSSIESATRRAVITGINQSVGKLQLARAADMGCNHVETTSHAGARPTHAEWQGMVFCLVGATREYANFYDATGYGDGDGLCGWNCYHSFFPFFEGLSTRSFSRDPAADDGRDNDKEYELQQKERYYERQVREAKKSCVIYDAALNAAEDEAVYNALRQDFNAASVKLKRREAALREFAEENNLPLDISRVMVGGFNHSVSAKAVWANKKTKSA